MCRMLKKTNAKMYQPTAIVKMPPAAKSSFLISRATLKPVKIFVQGAFVSLRCPIESSAMQGSLMSSVGGRYIS